MKTLQAGLSMLFLFVTAVTFSQIAYNDFDANRDGGIDRNEFNDRYGDTFDNYDVSRDGFVNDREFYDAGFNRLDRNGDRNLALEEWQEGFDNVYGDYLDSNDFNRYDVDGNENISNEEFYNSLRTRDYFSSYDTNQDGNLDRDELNEGIYKQWDRNQDSKIDQKEFDDYNSYFQGDEIRTRSSY